MLRSGLMAVACTLVALAAPARAHFVWIDLAHPPDGPSQVRVYFGEQPEPGEPHLIGKIGQTKVWVRSTEDGQPTAARELKIAPAAEKDLAAFVANCPDRAPLSLEASCDYGLFERGPTAVLLQYYAKHLAGDWRQAGGKLAHSERLDLDVVPELTDGVLRLQVLYRGKPIEGSDLVVIAPGDKVRETKTAAEGSVVLKSPAAGRYSVRAGYRQTDRGGKLGDRNYQQTWHYATLMFDLPSTSSATPAISAADLLAQARTGRSTWEHFPGFSADVTADAAGQQATGTVTIGADGEVKLALAGSLADWAQEQLDSLVQHRMPEGEVTTGEVRYADDDTAHPLGRKISLGDAAMQSVYRIQGDVIMEVNRSAGDMRFTISVLEIERNAENKYLPRAFTMNFFDAASGKLKTSTGYWNAWQRVAGFDLPKTILEISTKDGGTNVRRLSFDNWRRVEAK